MWVWGFCRATFLWTSSSVTRWSYLWGAYLHGAYLENLTCVVKGPSENWTNVLIDCP